MSHTDDEKKMKGELPPLDEDEEETLEPTLEDEQKPQNKGKKQGTPPAEDPKDVARRMLKQYAAPDLIEEATGLSISVISGLKGALIKSGELLPDEDTREGVGTTLPPEVQYIEDAKEFIKSRLSEIYGVGKGDAVIMKALGDDSSAMRDPNLLHSFIKSLAPKANDQQLMMFIIRPLFVQFPLLAQMVDLVARSRVSNVQQPVYIGGPMGWSGAQPIPGQYNYNDMPRGYGYGYPPAAQGPSVMVPQPGQQWPINLDYPYPTRNPPKTYKVVYDGQEIITDAEGYRAWQKYINDEAAQEEDREHRKEKHELEMVELKKKIENSGKEEDKVPVEINGQTINVPASLAPLYMNKGESQEVKELREKLEKEKEQRHTSEMNRLEEKINNQPSFLDQLTYYNSVAPQLGFHTGAKSTLDLIDSAREDLHTVAQSVINKMPGAAQEFKPNVDRTPDERKQAARKILDNLEKSEDLLQAEDEFLSAASKIT